MFASNSIQMLGNYFWRMYVQLGDVFKNTPEQLNIAK